MHQYKNAEHKTINIKQICTDTYEKASKPVPNIGHLKEDVDKNMSLIAKSLNEMCNIEEGKLTKFCDKNIHKILNSTE